MNPKINLREYPLRYYRKEDDRLFHVKRIGTDYVLVDSETFEKIRKTQHWLRVEFYSDKSSNMKTVKGLKVSA